MLAPGAKLAVNPDGKSVVVTRTLGARDGYRERWEAFAVARMSNADPAAVVQTDDQHWHPVQTNIALAANASAGVPALAMAALPTHEQLSTLKQRVDAVHAKLGAGQQLDAAKREHAAAVFGVGDPNEVRFNRGSHDRVADVVNLNTGWLKDPKAPRGLHGPERRPSELFDHTVATAIEIHPGELADTRAAAAVLHHEVSHLKDYELARAWVFSYKSNKGDPPIKGSDLSMRAFKSWLTAWTPNALSPADAEIVYDIATDNKHSTEARAYLRTFLAAIESGADDEASKQVTAYARELAKGGDPVQAPKLKQQLKTAMSATRNRLDKTGKAQFDAALGSARGAYRGAWFL